LETTQLERLENRSLAIIANPSISLTDKQAAVKKMGYNQQVALISRASQQTLYLILGKSAYSRLSNWVNTRWQVERNLHGKTKAAASARTYEIYATRYDSGGAYYAALPDQCVKLSNGGLNTCADKGYTIGTAYDVYLSYKKGTAARVGESGPWNIDDTYWATKSDPTPRRMFADLALGMPEAQAAYFNGYNGGLDQFGRVVTAPYGIDLARQVSIDIGLQPGNNDWINVTFMWTEGWGSSPGSSSGGDSSVGTSSGNETINPVKVAEPADNGSIVHVVQPGETYWAIAIAYETTIAEILQLNNLNEDSPIWPGDKLLIRPAQTNSSNPVTIDKGTITPTIEPSRTPQPTQTIAHLQTKAVEITTNTPKSYDPANKAYKAENAQVDPILVGSTVLVFVGLLIYLFGRKMDQ
jgi:hypothetical protein